MKEEKEDAPKDAPVDENLLLTPKTCETQAEYEALRPYSMINYVPTHRAVIIKEVKIEAKTNTGIIIPGEQDDKWNSMGMIVAMAPDAEFFRKRNGEVIEDVVIGLGSYVSVNLSRVDELNMFGTQFIKATDMDIQGKIPSAFLNKFASRDDKLKYLRDKIIDPNEMGPYDDSDTPDFAKG